MVRSARIQRNAVAAFRNAGGKVLYDWEWNDGKQQAGRMRWQPAEEQLTPERVQCDELCGAVS
jgi:hypothetical protein